MSDSMGKMAAIFVAVILFFGIPLVSMQERGKSAAQMYLLSEETELVDGICNTGMLTWEMYEQFLWSVAKMPGRYEVEILQEQKELVFDEGKVSYVSRYYDTEEIVEELKNSGAHYFYRNDYVRICVSSVEGTGSLTGILDRTMNVFYGGTVKNEAL